MDIGIATIAAFAEKRSPKDLTLADLDQVADYMETNYVVDPLKSFLTVAFPNAGFLNAAYNRQPEKRTEYAQKILRCYRPETPITDERCVFTGKPAVAVSLDLKDELPPGRTYRQHVPLTTGVGVINFHAEGNPGLPISGEALLALHALPLGCAKVAGRLLGVHSSDPDITLSYAKAFLEENREAVQLAREGGEKKLPEQPRRALTLLIDNLLQADRLRQEEVEEGNLLSITAYHFTNSGQGADLHIYHLPLEVFDFIQAAMNPIYRNAWDKVCARGWEISSTRRQEEGFTPRFNVVYEDLFRLPENANQFIRRYFLRVPARTRLKGDPRASYSLRSEADLVSWNLTELFLRKVVSMKQERINAIRDLGDVLAEYIHAENDKRFFNSFLMARNYAALRSALVRANVGMLRRGQPPAITFDSFIAVFEEGEELPYADWRLARDLLLIRLVEQLYQLGWIKANLDDLPDVNNESTVSDGEEVL
ncbi:MAG: type I-B CRISPR-associated protein Cas8b1/Cst1 [Bacillota bacterium]